MAEAGEAEEREVQMEPEGEGKEDQGVLGGDAEERGPRHAGMSRRGRHGNRRKLMVLDPSGLSAGKVGEVFLHKAKSLYRVNCGQDTHIPWVKLKDTKRVGRMFKDLNELFYGPWDDSKLCSIFANMHRTKRSQFRSTARAARRANNVRASAPTGCSERSWNFFMGEAAHGFRPPTYGNTRNHQRRNCTGSGGLRSFQNAYKKKYGRWPALNENRYCIQHGRNMTFSDIESGTLLREEEESNEGSGEEFSDEELDDE